MTNTKKDIAIIGISVFCPAGSSTDEFWHGISSGKDFITDAPEDVIDPEYFERIGDEKNKDVDRFYCKRGGFAAAFKVDPLRFGILPIMADGMDPDQLMSMAGSEMALRDAGVFDKGISLQNGSVIIGKGNFSGLIALRCAEIIRTANEFVKILKSSLPALTDEDLDRVRKAYQLKQGRWQPDMAIGTMPNLVASLVANRFDMHGPAYCVDAACASGIVAINQSIELLRSGQCDIAVAGGMHTSQSAMFTSAFNLMGALSRRQEITPFSKDADGLLVGQGGGFIVLKTLEKAVEDDDRIYAVIKETAVCSDGGGSHVTVTSVKGEARVMETAWKRAGMDPETVGLIEAHGTATPVGDRTEIAAVKEFFGDHTHRRAYIGSIKSNIGHTMPAAGMIGVIKTALSLYHRKIPPTLHCEEPLPGMYESRFLPPQEPMDWDGEKIPLVAGVNAFGFGGINSHAILTAYEKTPGILSGAPRIKPYMGETLLVSAADKDALIQKLRTGDYTNTGGDYRIVIFDPDEKRIVQAISVVEKDKPWRGRLDIWFSNKPLRSEGGKIAYLFPGFNLDQISETDSICDSFDLSRIEERIEDLKKQGETDPIHLHNVQIDFIQSCSMKALETLGIEADMYAGHSVGEWYATSYAGMAESEMGHMREAMENYEVPDTSLIAVSGINRETAESWCKEIPGLYLANDNCPGQVILCGDSAAKDRVEKRMDQEKIYYSILPFSSDLHTPLMAEKVQYSHDFLKMLRLQKGKVPVWSATTLEPIPTDKKAYMELVNSQLTRPVYFRELIEKLYEQENVRIFVQIGLGPLTGFVEDTLKDKDFSAISANLTTRDGADQLRRVLAALFVEGMDVDPDFLGVKPMHQVEHNLLILPKGAPLMDELPELTEVVQKRYGRGGAIDFESAATAHPIHRAATENLMEVMRTQRELTQIFEGIGVTDMTGSTGTTGETERTHASERSFTEPIRLTLEDHPYLLDHAIVRQPKDWPFKENLNAVVPFTMTIELLADIARKYEPNKKLVQVRKISALQWIPVPDVFEGVVHGIQKEPNHWELDLENYAKAEFYFADQWAQPPAAYGGDIDIGDEIMPPISSEDLYEGYAFHGPEYQSSKKTLKICTRGIANLTEHKGGKGSLLDIMGQQLGLFLHLTQEENTISFPVRLGEINFYDDYTDQKGIFEHTLIVTRLSEMSVVGDMVLKRDGKIWSVARDFVCQRFVNVRPVWYVSLKPQYHKLAEELSPGVYYYSGASSRANIQAMMSKRYIDVVDGEAYLKLKNGRQQREFLYSRIAVKDAVRIHIAQNQEEMVYPVQIFLHHDENGKPFVRGHAELGEKVDDLHVSLAHKGDEAVAMVSEHPVGIDIEKIEEKAESFLSAAFTEKERSLLRKGHETEDAIRFWVAKEACGKKLGIGLQGDPKRYEIRKIDGDIIHVGDEKVQITKIGEEHIAGWTI